MIRVGTRPYRVVPPRVDDPRLHTAAVIVSIHFIGLAALGFEVTIPHILVAIAVGGLVDLVMTLRTTGAIVWPASGMLTGSGVALILRITQPEFQTVWSWSGWHWYALVSLAGVGSKYLIRWRGSHIFNPSNVALVVAFLLFGRELIEPLDFWWAPMGPWMGLAYLIIIGGGFLITRRLGLHRMVVAFWVSFGIALAVLAAPGHCMTTTWSLTPVCDSRFWWTLMTSPEVLVFMFFMITDPKTIPRTPYARVVFGAGVAVLATLLIAPQTIEFGAKVGLLSALVLLSPTRALFDRWAEMGTGSHGRAKALLSAGAALVIAAGIVIAGLGARLPAPDSLSEFVDTEGPAAAALPEVVDRIDASDLPPLTVDPGVTRLDPTAVEEAEQMAVMFLENLVVEGQAIREGDPEMLRLATAGQRYIDLMEIVEASRTGNEFVVPFYDVESLRLRVVEPREAQSVALGFEAIGSVEWVTYGSGGVEIDRVTEPLESTFLVRKITWERWRIVHEMEGTDA